MWSVHIISCIDGKTCTESISELPPGFSLKVCEPVMGWSLQWVEGGWDDGRKRCSSSKTEAGLSSDSGQVRGQTDAAAGLVSSCIKQKFRSMFVSLCPLYSCSAGADLLVSPSDCENRAPELLGLISSALSVPGFLSASIVHKIYGSGSAQPPKAA